MSIHNSASAWWLGFSVPLWLITINPIVGVVALGSAALVLLVCD